MKTLLEVIKWADEKGVGVGHFNISDLAALKAIFEAARKLGVPVIIGTSEGEGDFLGRGEAAFLVKNLREKHDFPIFINSDHTHSMDKVKEAVDAGYDEILFDAGKLSLEDNIKQTKEVVRYVKAVRPEILVEGELGYIGSSSQILKEVPEGAAINPDDLTKPEDARRFVMETGVDMLAPAVGNLHGMFANAPNPRLDIARIKAIREAAGVPLVLHGGSGIVDKDFVAALASGVDVVHINTEIRVAWRKGLEAELKAKPDEVTPYKILPGAIREVEKVVFERLKLFNRL